MNIYIKDLSINQQRNFYLQAQQAYQTLLSQAWTVPGDPLYNTFHAELLDIDKWLSENDR